MNGTDHLPMSLHTGITKLKKKQTVFEPPRTST